ncbi:hypothetical protein COLO4_36079 [Corchorus olitorius]|uniref:Uncharacterized protein n=1 Tax=Corchorus olitorius TaxID=93759 RepID=A0A1R3GB48_9ROSI|nr:hypothetical protein COLO4_36079 [Corchorus olitorius]
MTSSVSVTPVRLFQETPDSRSTEVTMNVDTSSALPTSNGVNLSGTDTQWSFSTYLNLTPSSGLFAISSRARPELDQDRGARLRSEVHAEQSVSSTVRSRDRARDADRTQNREGSRSQTRGNGDRQNRRSISQPVPDLNEIPTRTEPLAPARAEVATREERGRRRDRSRRDATYTDNSLATKIEQMQEEIKRLKRADRTDATPVDPMDNLKSLFDKAQRYIEVERVQSLKQRSTIDNRLGRDNPKEVNRDNRGSSSRRSPN